MTLRPEVDLLPRVSANEHQPCSILVVDEATGCLVGARHRRRACPLRIGGLLVRELEPGTPSILADRGQNAHDVAILQRRSLRDALERRAAAEVRPVHTPAVDEQPTVICALEAEMRCPRDVELRVRLQGDVVEFGETTDRHAITRECDARDRTCVWPPHENLCARTLHSARLTSAIGVPQGFGVASGCGGLAVRDDRDRAARLVRDLAAAGAEEEPRGRTTAPSP